MPFTDIVGVTIAEKRQNLGTSFYICSRADLKPLSTANMFYPPRALKIKPDRPYFNPSSWLFSTLVLKFYAGPFLQPEDTGIRRTRTEIRKAYGFSLTLLPKICGYTSGQYNPGSLTTSPGLPPSSVCANHLRDNSVFQKDFAAPTKLYVAET